MSAARACGGVTGRHVVASCVRGMRSKLGIFDPHSLKLPRKLKKRLKSRYFQDLAAAAKPAKAAPTAPKRRRYQAALWLRFVATVAVYLTEWLQAKLDATYNGALDELLQQEDRRVLQYMSKVQFAAAVAGGTEVPCSYETTAALDVPQLTKDPT